MPAIQENIEARVTEQLTAPVLAARRRMVAAAQLFAMADKSDPFTFSRCMAHIKNGVASVSRPASKEYQISPGTPAYYDAGAEMEERRIVHEGGELTFMATVFKNLVRP